MSAAPPPRAQAFTLPSQGAWTVDAHTGQRSDPVTVYVHGTLPEIESALQKGGWRKADPQGLSASTHYLGAASEQEAFDALHSASRHLRGVEIGVAGAFGDHLHPTTSGPTQVGGVNRMPISPQTMDGRTMVEGWEANNNPLGGRDHLRIFDTGRRDANGLPVYAIAASRDRGITFAPDHPETGFLFHTVEPDVSAEREKVLGLLTANANVTAVNRADVPFEGRSATGERVGDSTVVEVTLGGQRFRPDLAQRRI